MERQEATARIAELIIMYSATPAEVAAVIADKIYADVVATAVDDERQSWIEIGARDPAKVM